MTRAKRIAANLAILSVSAGICLLLIEGLLRVAGIGSIGPCTACELDFLVWDGFHGNDLVAGYSAGEVVVNSMGHRGSELDPTRPHRIVCMGDSSTFGLRSERQPEPRAYYDSYPAELRRLLDTGGHEDWQVINAGVPGSNSSHSLRILRREVLPLAPQIVTLRVGVNDHALRGFPWVHDPISPSGRALFYFLGDLRLFQAGLAVYERAFPREGGRAIPLESFSNDLAVFARLSREHGFRLVFLDYPLRQGAASDPDAQFPELFFYGEDIDSLYRVHARYQQAVRVVAKRERVPLLVTAPALARSDPPGFDTDFVHPNATGMRITAELLYDYLEREGWLAEETSTRAATTGG